MDNVKELEVVELGDATELTKGALDPINSEDHPTQSRRELD